MSDVGIKILSGAGIGVLILILSSLFPAVAVMITAIVIVGLFLIFKD